MNNYKITFMPENNEIVVKEGSTIKEAITEAGLDFDFPCGGKGTCKKCRIKILNKVVTPTEKEISFFERKEI